VGAQPPPCSRGDSFEAVLQSSPASSRASYLCLCLTSSLVHLSCVSEQLLHDAAVFETLRLRYFEDKIYTQAGPTSLISINPYKQIVPLYTQRAIEMYSSNSENAPPHVFGVAQTAFNNLVEHNVCQSILCSGESGAGKTEVAKLVVQFLAATTSKESGACIPHAIP